MRTCFGSVIYAASMKYFGKFLESLFRQTNRDFSILFINDNIDAVLLEEEISKFPKLSERIECINVYINLEPYQLRIALLREAKLRGYDLLLLGDCDDFFSLNRVALTICAFEDDYTFYYNDMRDFNYEDVMPCLPLMTKNIYDIGEYNYLGLTNTAINLNKVSFSFLDSLESGKTRVFDWYLYSRILLFGGVGKKVEKCYTYYRVYESNIAGKVSCDNASCEREISIKIEHYGLLKQFDSYFNELYNLYNEGLQIDVVKRKIYYWWNLTRIERKKDV